MKNLLVIENKEFDDKAAIDLYKLNKWSSADKPELLLKALKNSHTLVLAYLNGQLVGLGNAISDGFLVVYYPHLLVHPDLKKQGIGKLIMEKFMEKYKGFHQQMLTADDKAIEFYKNCGFERAGNTEPMWIYKGNEH